MGGYERPGADLCENLGMRIPSLPHIMRQKGWPVAAQLMARWLNMPANSIPERGAHDTTSVHMDWVLGFPRANAVYEVAKANKVWLSEMAKKAIEKKLIRDKNRLPQKVGERLEIGNVGDGLVRSGSDMARFHEDWQIQFSLVKQSMVFSPIDDLYGALGNFYFYYLVKGHVERLTDENGQPRYKVTLNKVGVYVRDSYDFNDGADSWHDKLMSQPLGQWGCVPPSVGRLPMLDTYYVNNEDFRKWRRQYGHSLGGDFLVFSDIKQFNVNDSFVFPQNEG